MNSYTNTAQKQTSAAQEWDVCISMCNTKNVCVANLWNTANAYGTQKATACVLN